MKAIDLGLSVKWATCNIGATKPEEYGNYYAWGELKQKKTYKKINYKFAINMKGVEKNEYAKYNQHDNKTTLEPIDDIATQTLGEQWRMPTDAEWAELLENCEWTWTTLNEVNGYEVKSKTNGNSIFLPAAGIRYYDDLSNAGNGGGYWSSSLYTDYPNYAWGVDFNYDYVYRNYISRFYGQSVRPVLSND